MKQNVSKWCVIWRSGGLENFEWHRSLAMTRDEAVARQREMENSGHRCHVADYRMSVAIGLPDTYDR